MDIDCPNFETCEGILTFRVYQDSDGDPAAPWTVRSWTDAECVTMTCNCDLDAAEWDRLTVYAIEAERNAPPIID